MKPTVRAITPLQSWDIYSEYLAQRAREAARKRDMSELDVYASRYGWEFDTGSIKNEDYTTIVITDSAQKIQWVNPGFTKMTGYPKTYAIGKHPRFLQGKETSVAVKSEIHSSLSSGEPVSKQLLNYRKDGTSYLCDIKIIPLFNREQELAHFVAFEKKAKVV